MTLALCPGSFDPVTNGHMDIIARAAGCFSEVVVGVITNPAKTPMFSSAERVAMLEQLFADRPNVRVEPFDGLVVNAAERIGATSIVKGLRAVADFEYELQMAHMNEHLSGVTTLFLPTSPHVSFISSSLVKEVAKLGGSVVDLVPGVVSSALQERI